MPTAPMPTLLTYEVIVPYTDTECADEINKTGCESTQYAKGQQVQSYGNTYDDGTGTMLNLFGGGKIPLDNVAVLAYFLASNNAPKSNNSIISNAVLSTNAKIISGLFIGLGIFSLFQTYKTWSNSKIAAIGLFLVGAFSLSAGMLIINKKVKIDNK